MKVKFRVEERGTTRIVTCPDMPGFMYKSATNGAISSAYTAFIEWMKDTFDLTTYVAEETNVKYVEVDFKVIGD